MKILITGATGFIGRNLSEQFGLRHVVSAPSRSELDLVDAVAVRNYLELQRFDIIIHAAGERVTHRDPGGPGLVGRNCRMFFNLARNAHVFERLFFLSSGAVYDRLHWRGGMQEEDFDAHLPGDDYGFSKYVCAKAAEAMDKVYEFRVFGVFGPHEDWRWRFLSNACCRALWGLPIIIRENVRFDYLDVADMGCILERFLKKELSYRQYNICRGVAFELAELAEKLVAISGKKVPVVIQRAGKGTTYSGDNRRMRAELPGWQFRTIEDSLESLYRWYATRLAEIDKTALLAGG